MATVLENGLCCKLLILFCTVCVCFAYQTSYGEIDSAVKEYKLPDPGFTPSELEPHIDEATIRAHHGGHHLTYTTNLNGVLARWRDESPKDALAGASILQILQNLDFVPKKYKTDIINQGGGFLNHCIYWATMSPNMESERRRPHGQIKHDINKYFGSFDSFKEEFNKKAKTLFGSGYVWLSRDRKRALVISTTINQVSPVSEGLQPILTLDVWEHAYYLLHKFRRPSYINHWWYTVDWDKVDELDQWWASKDHRDEL